MTRIRQRLALKSFAATVFYGGLFFGVRDPLFASIHGRPLFFAVAAALSLTLMVWPRPTLRALAYGACMTALATRALGFLFDVDRPWQSRLVGALVYLYVAYLTTELVVLRTEMFGPTGRRSDVG